MSPVTELQWSQGVFQFPFPRAFPLHTVLRERGELDKRMTGTVKGSIIYISLSYTDTQTCMYTQPNTQVLHVMRGQHP